MSPPPRSKNGRFTTEKQLKKRLKILEAIKKRKETKKEKEEREADKESKVNSIVEGRRIVEIGVMARYLVCVKCEETLSLLDIEKETRHGLASIFHVKCRKCELINFVPSGKHNGTERSDGKTYAINTDALQGSINAGLNLKSVKKFLNIMGIPGETSKLLQQDKNQIGPETKQAAEERERLETEEKKKELEAKKKGTKRKSTSKQSDVSMDGNIENHQNAGINVPQHNVNNDCLSYHQNLNQCSTSQQNFNNGGMLLQGNYTTNSTVHTVPHKKAISQQYFSEQMVSQNFFSTNNGFPTNTSQYLS